MFGFTFSPSIQLVYNIAIVSAILVAILAVNAILANRRYKTLRSDMEMLLGQINSTLTTMFSVVRKTSGEMDRLFADPANTFGLERLETVRADITRQKEAVQQIRQIAPTPTFLMREAVPALQRALRVFEKNTVTMLRQWDSVMEDLQSKPQMDTIAAPPPDESHLELRLASLQNEYNQLRKMHENLITSHQQARNSITELEGQLAQIGNQEAQEAQEALLRPTDGAAPIALENGADVDARILEYQQALRNLETELEQQAQAHREQINALQKETASTQADKAMAERLQERVEALEARNAELESMNEMLVEEAAQYVAPPQDMDEDELYAKYLTALEKQQDLAMEVENLRHAAPTAGADGTDALAANDETLRIEMERMQQSADALAKQYQEKEQRLQEREARAKEEVEALKLELDLRKVAIRELGNARDVAVTTLNDETARHQQAQDALRAEIQALQNRLEAALQASSPSTPPSMPPDTDAASTEMIESLRASLQTLEEAHQNLEAEAAALRARLQRVEAERDRARADLEQALSSQAPDGAAAPHSQTPPPPRPSHKDLEMALDELETIRAAAREETAALQARIAELEQQAPQMAPLTGDDDTPQAMGAPDGELAAARAQCQALTDDLEATRQMFAEDLEALEQNAAEDLQREREEREEERRKLEQAARSWQEQAEAALGEQKRLAEELATSQRKTSGDMDAQLAAVRDDLQKEQARRQEESTRLESQIASLNSQIEEADRRFESLRQERETEQRQVADRINSAVADVMKDLQKEQFLRSEERREWENERQALEARLEEQTASARSDEEQTAMIRRLESLEEESSRLRATVLQEQESFETQYAEMEARSAALQQELNQTTQEKQRVREELDRARQAIKELYPIVRGLEQQNRQQHEALLHREPAASPDQPERAEAPPYPHANDETQTRLRDPNLTPPPHPESE